MNQKTNIEIKTKFLSIKSWEDLVRFVSFFQDTEGAPKANLIFKKDIAHILFSNNPKYLTYFLPKKKKNKKRLIQAPSRKLKEVQKILNYCIQLCFTPKSAAHGFVKERSIVTNAKMHVGRKYVYNIDLENFFPTIHFGRVKGVFKGKPFNFPSEIAKMFANICCNEGQLPQGAPTSPVISNLICRGLDAKLSMIAKENKAKFSRYADDITFSSNRDIFNETFLNQLKSIVSDEGFRINETKVRLRNFQEQQIVTGLVVNKKVNITPRFKKDLRILIKLWENYGQEDAQNWLQRNYKYRHRYEGSVPNIEKVILGKMNFLKMVVGQEREFYIKWSNRFRGILSGKKIDDLRKKQIVEELEKVRSNIGKSVNLDEKKELYIQHKLLLNELDLITDDEREIKRQNHWFENLIRKNESFLFHPLYDRDSVNPDSLLDEDYFLPQYTILEKKKSRGLFHNPLYTVKFLQKFRDSDSSLKILAHSDDVTLNDLIPKVKSEFKQITKSEAIPVELYKLLNTHIGMMEYDVQEKKVGDIPVKEYYRSNQEKLYKFTRMIRFDLGDGKMSLKNIIIHHLKENTLIKNKGYWLLDLQNDIDKEFKVLTATRNISLAIETILKIYGEQKNESEKLCGLKFKVLKTKNSTRLQIIDMGSVANISAENFFTNLSGDFRSLKAILFGYCDLNIQAVFKGGQWNKVFLLPEKQVIEPIEEPEGFTCELIFYHSLKVLLLDDKEDRFDNLYKKRMTSPSKALIYSKDLTIIDQINEYNTVLLHNSFKGTIELGLIEKKCRKHEIPLVLFTGDVFDTAEIEHNKIQINDEEMYRRLPTFIQKIEKDNTIDINCFKISRSEQQKDKEGLIELKKQLIHLLDTGEIEPQSIPADLHNQLSSYIYDLPSSFSSRASMLTFINREIDRI